MRIVTGHTGTEHVTGDDVASLFAKTYGNGTYFAGDEITIPAVSGQTISLRKADILMQGIHCRIEGTETFDVSQTPASQWRKDLICAVYSKTAGGVESVTLSYKTGNVASSESGAQLPSYTAGDIRGGASTAEAPIYIVTVNGSDVSVASAISIAKTHIGIEADIDELRSDAEDSHSSLSSRISSVSGRTSTLETKLGNTKFRYGSYTFPAEKGTSTVKYQTISFGQTMTSVPKVFITAQTMANNPSDANQISTAIGSVTKTGFNAFLVRGTITSAVTVNWLAICL